MKHVIIVLTLLTSFGVFSQNENQSETSTFYFIRHAEKNRSDTNNKNPHLTSKGITRANNWVNILKGIKFDKIYSTDFNRTRETALPTATRNGLDIVLYNPRKDINEEAFKKLNKGKTVLIVGHSNTTPAFVNTLLGKEKYKDIDDSNNGNLYIITIMDGEISDQVLTIN